jgi:hypothetical protein
VLRCQEILLLDITSPGLQTQYHAPVNSAAHHCAETIGQGLLVHGVLAPGSEDLSDVAARKAFLLSPHHVPDLPLMSSYPPANADKRRCITPMTSPESNSYCSHYKIESSLSAMPRHLPYKEELTWNCPGWGNGLQAKLP